MTATENFDTDIQEKIFNYAKHGIAKLEKEINNGEESSDILGWILQSLIWPISSFFNMIWEIVASPKYLLSLLYHRGSVEEVLKD